MEDDKLQLGIKGGSPAVIHASGELNYRNCDSLSTLIRDALGGDVSAVELALGELDFIDSSGLRILVTAAQEARKLGRSLNIISLTPQLSHMLDVSGFRRLFDDVAAPPSRAEIPAAVPSPAAKSYYFEAPADLAACQGARDGVCNFAAGAGLSSLDLADIKLAVGEAISNAVRHGTCGGEAIQIQCEIEGERLQVMLKYPSAAFDFQGIPAPDVGLLSEGGMGIYFMKLVMDAVNYEFKDGIAVLTLEKRIRKSRRPQRGAEQP